MGGERLNGKQELKQRSLNSEIWHLLWPVLLLTLAQKLGAAFEGVLVSVNNPDELTVIGICHPYTNLITTVSHGFSIGINAMVGRAVGGGYWNSCRKKAEKLFLLILLGCSCVMSLVTAGALAVAFSDAPELASMGWSYMMPYLLGSPVLLLFSAIIAAMRGLGHTDTGMWMTFLSVPLQVGISWFCYTNFGVGALGYGIILARLAGSLYGYRCYRKEISPASEAALPAGFARDFVKLAIPVSLSKAISPVASAAINELLFAIGAVYVGASGLGGRLEVFFYIPAMAMGTVAITVVARQGKDANLFAICKRLCLWSILPTLIFSIAAGLLRDPVWAMLTPDAATQEAGRLYWSCVLWAYPLIALEMTTTSVLQALGLGMPALVITVIRLWGIQLPAAWLSAQLGWGPVGVWAGFVLSNLLSALISIVWAGYKFKNRTKTTADDSRRKRR